VRLCDDLEKKFQPRIFFKVLTAAALCSPAWCGAPVRGRRTRGKSVCRLGVRPLLMSATFLQSDDRRKVMLACQVDDLPSRPPHSGEVGLLTAVLTRARQSAQHY